MLRRRDSGWAILPALVAAALLLIRANGFSAASSSSESVTGIEGVILISHHPPRMNREDAPSSPPLAGATFTVQTGNTAVGSFTTDERGGFRVLLAPGQYTVSQPPNTHVRQCGPWDVEVVAGGMTKVEWYCEVGGRPTHKQAP
jgi:hypothetical protein